MAKSKRKKRTKRARCGRPRIEGCMREPNGRISRARKSREPIDQLAIQMRMKHLELTYEEAKNPLSGSYIGRLYLLGGKDGLSQEQYDVAQQYLRVRNNYFCAKGFSSGCYDDAMTTPDQEGLEEWVTAATEQFLAVKEIIEDMQGLYHQHNLYAALQYLVVEDQSLPHLVGSLRIVLNALHRYFECCSIRFISKSKN
ncbi:hypothetical protein [Bartonella ancashensis]|uniref:Uncharacterized protein n=2 Tax=Bartonella ancashensis TaxID=1318743 RepID=A0A0M4L6W3_9HYPH|nr:hypothetical protein [Bartonella ancashensis]ALE03508.1 hypothetical protein PU02_0694 [Bartonella ancashensis]